MKINKKWLTAGLLFLCIESALIDHIMDMQEKENAQSSRWNAAMISEINKLANGDK